MAQSFDAKLLKILGDPVSLAEGVSTFSVSRNVLVYQRGPAGSATPSQQLAWFDRKGTISGQVIPSASFAQGIELSPDGHRAAVSEFSSGTSALQDVWTIDLDKKVPTRFTFDPSFNNGPAWSPDGSWIVFGSSRGGGTVPNKIFQKLANGGGAEDLVYALEPQDALYTEDWSRDGQNVVFERTLVRTLTFDIWRLPLSGDKKPVVYLSSPFNKIQAKVSPDGHWLAYSTNESGTYQLVVQTFPDPSGGKWQITANGGVEPRWRRDGRELYYLGLDGKLMAVPIRPDKTFQWGEATPLFQTPIPAAPVIPFPHHYDVTADGQRFLMVVPADAPSNATRKDQPQSTLVAVVNWTSALKKK
jgi:Tol biopolymer transport system component